ncbi:MAG: hypothetical protein WAM14_23520 [Candidatus Nitrosopolaris sp.]
MMPIETEKNVDVRERLLLVRHVLVDNEQAAIIESLRKKSIGPDGGHTNG